MARWEQARTCSCCSCFAGESPVLAGCWCWARREAPVGQWHRRPQHTARCHMPDLVPAGVVGGGKTGYFEVRGAVWW